MRLINTVTDGRALPRQGLSRRYPVIRQVMTSLLIRLAIAAYRSRGIPCQFTARHYRQTRGGCQAYGGLRSATYAAAVEGSGLVWLSGLCPNWQATSCDSAEKFARDSVHFPDSDFTCLYLFCHGVYSHAQLYLTLKLTRQEFFS
jgi:hypothetical protein